MVRMESLYMHGLNVIQNRVREHGDAVMFDIDDTLIYQVLAPSGQRNEWMIDLLKEAKDLGYYIIIITARPSTKETIEYTIAQLHNYNIYYDELMFVPAENKTDAKKQSKWKYILSVGDMETDLTDSEHVINTSSGYYN
ncbi:hypothetical protein [Dishui Lake phycodnavirus 4]|nr:hypothetical protein [Dishui Lake phycodnavirus 4]